MVRRVAWIDVRCACAGWGQTRYERLLARIACPTQPAEVAGLVAIVDGGNDGTDSDAGQRLAAECDGVELTSDPGRRRG